MSKAHLSAVEALFQAAVELPPEQRQAFLESRCHRDDELRALVAQLLAHHDAGLGDFLEAPVVPAATSDLTGGEPAAPRSPAFSPGEHLAGRYCVKNLLGQGGMGEVYEVWDDELSIPVALKTVRIDPDQDADPAIRRFKQEALLARAVVHPNVCRVYDFGCHRAETSAVWFLTMEVLRGQTLHERLKARRRFTLDEALPLVTQMAAGLEAAHQAGVVHGDFKSGNVMLVAGGQGEQAVVTDFGLARETRDRAGGSATAAERDPAAGTPAYMAPERLRGAAPTPAADIYALGVVLFEMCTGKVPFTGSTPWDSALRRLDEPPPSPRSLVQDLEDRWEQVIGRCLAREPGRRFGSAADVAKALAGLEPAAASLDAAAGPIGTRSRLTLPVEQDTFVGREQELAAVTGRLAGGARLVTLAGMAGMGKTRIAIHYARRDHATWKGGVWFCDLAETRNLEGIASAVARALGLQLGRGDPITQVGHAIAGRKHCLVILDNFEPVVELTGETVGRWLERAPLARFLVTSRERLNLPIEEVLGVEPLAPGPALALFVERARRLCPALTLAGEELAAAREVVRLAEGIPLAIELAAARMRVMSVTKLVEGMQKRFRLLTGGASARHETLAAAIDGSWELLQPWEQAALAQCSVFEGGFTLDAAEQVIDLRSWLEAPWVIDVVQSLVDKSLLLVRLADGGPSARMPARFGMLVSLQEYARRKLDEADAIPGEGSGTAAARAAEERHGLCFARHGAEDPTESIERDGGDARRQLVYRELDNLVTACRRAIGRGDGNTAATVFRAANEVFDRRGPFATAIQLGKEILDAELAPELRARTLLAVGTAEARSGRPDAARAHLGNALAIFRELGHTSGEGFVLGNLGGVEYSTGKYEEALACYQTAMDIQRAEGNRRMEGANLANIGLVHHTQGKLEEARACFETSAAMQREAGNLRSLAIVLSSLGHLHLHQGKIAEARGCFESALDIHRELGDRPFIGSVLGNLGTLCLARGQLAEARSYFEAALEVHREVGNRPTEGVILGDLGNVYLEQDLIEPARSTLEAALGISREVGDKRSEGIHLTHLGNALFEAGRIEEALALEETALALNRQVGHRRFEGITLGYLSLIHLAQGRTDAARAALAAGEAILREMADPLELARLLCARSLLESMTGELGSAGATLGEVEVLAERSGIWPDSELYRRIARVREAVQAHA